MSNTPPPNTNEGASAGAPAGTNADAAAGTAAGTAGTADEGTAAPEVVPAAKVQPSGGDNPQVEDGNKDDGEVDKKKASEIHLDLRSVISVVLNVPDNQRPSSSTVNEGIELFYKDPNKDKTLIEKPFEPPKDEAEVEGNPAAVVAETSTETGANAGGRRRTKRKGRKGSKKSKKGAKKSKKSSQSNQSQNGGRRSRKNRRKHSHRRKH